MCSMPISSRCSTCPSIPASALPPPQWTSPPIAGASYFRWTAAQTTAPGLPAERTPQPHAWRVNGASLDLAVELRVDPLGQAEGRGVIGDFDAVEFEGIKTQLHRQGAQAQVHFIELVA